jgi:hypothetical protein
VLLCLIAGAAEVGAINDGAEEWFGKRRADGRLPRSTYGRGEVSGLIAAQVPPHLMFGR